jgi:hypothetical protein
MNYAILKPKIKNDLIPYTGTDIRIEPECCFKKDKKKK